MRGTRGERGGGRALTTTVWSVAAWLAATLWATPAGAAAPAPAPPTAHGEPALGPEAAPDDEGLGALGDVGDIEDLDLEDLLSTKVSAATKSELTAAQTPAVVTVITGDEMRARGYTSVAEALATVPGFYDVYDLVHHNVGVRGINGGPRAAGNVLKVMVDGQDVSFRPTTGNLLGEELIPVGAIERVEVIRGPASALYGANAFLGAVNIITRRGASGPRATVSAGTGVVRGRAAGRGGLTLSASSEGGPDVLVAVSGAVMDRSGLTLPSTSPALGLTASPIPGRGASREDVARPVSAFARASLGEVATGRWTATAIVSRLEAGAEWQDFEPLTHRGVVSQLDQTYRLSFALAPSPTWSVNAWLAFSDHAPTDQDRVGLDRDDEVLLRTLGSTGWDLGAELKAQPWESLQLVLGTDFTLESHTLATTDTRLLEDRGTLAAGTVLPGPQSGRRRRLRNGGAYGQAVLQLGRGWSITAGLRSDHHNVLGTFLSPRAAIVWAPVGGRWNAKLLYGSSFKAPSAEQLFAAANEPGAIEGNRSLQAQRAHTVELAGGVDLPDQWGEVLANVYGNFVSGRVEYVPKGLYLTAENRGQEIYAGGELSLRLALHRALELQLSGGAVGLVQGAQDELAVVTTSSAVELPLYPVATGRLTVVWRLPWWGLRLTSELRAASERASSRSNTKIAGGHYDVPGYVDLDMSLGMLDLGLWEGHATRVVLRAANLFGANIVEPGFNGIDVPQLGPTVWLTVSQEL